jgi:GntR family transcriptional regulator, transcriptional repressor for pyruvate dehydrogenase complex
MLSIEPAIAAAAMMRITKAELNLLEENVDRTRRAAAHVKDLVALDVEFHFIPCAASRSRALQLCHAAISQLFYPAFIRLILRLNVFERLVFIHQQVLDGLRDRDVGQARVWMEKRNRRFSARLRISQSRHFAAHQLARRRIIHRLCLWM